MASEYKIGTAIEDMDTLDALGITADPRSTFQPFSAPVRLADSTLQGNGFPVVTWHWDVMVAGWSDILAEFLDGNLSAPVYITTKQNRLSTGPAYTFATYQCVMNWPTGDEDIQSKRSVGLTIEFTHLVEVVET